MINDLLHGPVSRLRLGIRHANLCRTLARKKWGKKVGNIYGNTDLVCFCAMMGRKGEERWKKFSKSNAIYDSFCIFFIRVFGWFIVYSIFSCHFLSRLNLTKLEFFTHVAMSTVFFGSQFSYQTKFVRLGSVFQRKN